MKDKDYEGALNLSLDGEKSDEAYRGLVSKWKKKRYNIYEVAGMLDEQRALARALIYENEFDYYLKLKETYGEAQWQAIYPEIHETISKTGQRFMSIYPMVLIEEEAWFKLLIYVRERPSNIVVYQEYLVEDYPLEVYRIYVQYIEGLSAGQNNRKGYRKVCREIKNLRKLGGIEQADNIIKVLQETYKRRPAFVEELSKVKSQK